MNLVKSILLGSATAFVAFTANAADLPRKSAPVAACNFGPGFFQVPGTNSCIQIGGLMRAEYAVGSSTGLAGDYGRNQYGFGSRFFLSVDHRTNTSYGLVRSYGRIFNTRGIDDNYDAPLNGNGSVNMLEAYVQFAGFKFGFDQSNFNFYNNDWNYGGAQTLAGAHDRRNNMLSYTASLMPGLLATIALEDGAQTRYGLTAPLQAAHSSTPIAAGGAYVGGYNRVPDVVGNLNYKGTWGEAQVGGALHNVSDSRGYNAWGWAATAGAKINAGTTPGSQFLLLGSMANGANSYVATRGQSFGVLGNAPAGLPTYLEAYGNTTADGLSLTKSWSALAGYNHIWSSQFRTALTAGMQNVDTTGGAYDMRTTTVALTNVWVPVAGLSLGLELFYDQTKLTSNGTAASLEGKTMGANFRVTRGF